MAALNHPKICTLHDIGQQDGIDYLVMEYLEGQTLAQRLETGPLPRDQALQYAIQVADALGKAHRARIVHRDLKPGNVMITKAGAKLLDFGLAKLRPGSRLQAFGSGPGVVPPTATPTATAPLTGQGTILGTLQYMAPEQLEGKDADARTDIFAFGAVIYETLTGRKAFEGKSQASLIATILEHDPAAISSFQPLTPPLVDHVVKRCLAKDPNERWQAASDLMRELKWIVEGGSPTSMSMPAVGIRKNREHLAWALAAVAVLVAAAALTVAYVSRTSRREVPTTQESVRFSVSPPQDAAFTGGLFYAPAQALSPDGHRMVFRAQRHGGADVLWVRSLDSLEAQALPGTDGGDFPFWSPDSRFIGFFAQGKLKKIDVAGGPAQTLCDAPAGEGGTWNRDGIIVFAPTAFTGLSRVSAAGGQPTSLTTLEPAGKEISHRWPQFLPDGRRFLFLVQPGNAVRVGSLDSRDTKTLLTADSKVLYAPPGYVLFMREGTLMARQFDASRAELTGDGFPVAEQVRGNPNNGRAAFSVSENGVLAYRTGVGNVVQLTWFDRSGKVLQSIGQPGNYIYVDLSPDDGRAVVDRREASGHGDLWLFDFARGTTSRLTFSVSVNTAPHWSPDGSRIAFMSDRDGGIRNLYQKSATGAGQDEVLLKSSMHKATTSWSSDGRFIVYDSDDPKTGTDLWVLPLLGDRKPMPFLRTEFNEGQGRLSPDGRWMAYVSNETGRNEVYVQPFPASGAKWQISTNGGLQPRWRRDGRELFYIDVGGLFVMDVEVRATATAFDVGAPAALFRMRPGSLTPVGPSAFAGTVQPYAVSADGQRFLILSPAAETAPDSITVVLNWTAGLKK